MTKDDSGYQVVRPGEVSPQKKKFLSSYVSSQNTIHYFNNNTLDCLSTIKISRKIKICNKNSGCEVPVNSECNHDDSDNLCTVVLSFWLSKIF